MHFLSQLVIKQFLLLSPRADRHAGIYRLLFLSLFLCLSAKFCNGYLRHGLMQGDEMWQDGRPGWVTGHLIFWWTLAQGLAPRPKVKNVGNALDSRKPDVTDWPVTTLAMQPRGYRHVGIYAIRDNWRTCIFHCLIFCSDSYTCCYCRC